MNHRQRATLSAIFEEPNRPDIEWRNIESLLIALGATVTAGRGSRVRVAPGERTAVFHRPHPEKETDKGTIGSLRRFLIEAGGEP